MYEIVDQKLGDSFMALVFEGCILTKAERADTLDTGLLLLSLLTLREAASCSLDALKSSSLMKTTWWDPSGILKVQALQP